MDYAVSLFARSTRNNIKEIYGNIMEKYSPDKQRFIKWSNKYYSLCHASDDYFTNTNCLNMDLPYPEDIQNYIKATDNYYKDTDVLNRFFIKIKNENSNALMDFVLAKIEQLHSKTFIKDVADYMSEEDLMYLENILEDNPVVLEVCRKFSTDNLLMRN